MLLSKKLSVFSCLFLLIICSLAANPQELRFGNTAQGNMGEGETHLYSVKPSADGLVIVETFGDLDTFLEIYDSSSDLIAYDDDRGEDYNARVEFFVKSGETYLIQLYCYFEDESGPYQIKASFETAIADIGNTDYNLAAPLNLGEEVTVYFRSSDESRWYRFNISRAGTVTIQTKGNLDTLLYLYDSEGDLIAEDDDSGDDFNAFISESLGSGTYYIEIMEYFGQMGRSILHSEFR